MHRGQEYGRGWRTRIEVDGVGVDIVACHHSRQRVPRGHEFAQQISRGRPLSMVEEVSHEWRVSVLGHRPITVRVNPNGSFSLDGIHSRERDLIAAVTAGVKRRLEAAQKHNQSRPTP